MRHAFAVALSFGFLAGATSAVAHAQLATRTWVSGVGDDANPCSRTSPCRTFAGALAKTAGGGEISVMDPGEYGTVHIEKSITLDGAGTMAGITAAGTNGVTVNGHGIVVILRNLDIHGVRSGGAVIGVRFLLGKTLIIENTRITEVQVNGIQVDPMAGFGNLGNLVVTNSLISVPIAAGTRDGHGIRTSFGNTTVSNSLISGNARVGLFAQDTGVINADSNVLTFNGVAVQAGNGSGTGQSAATVRLSNNDVYNNLTGFGCGGGVLASAGNNRKGSNVGGTVVACAPTVAITQQ